MKRASVLMLVMILLGSGTAWAQLEIGAQVRPRSEYRHGFKRLLKPNEEAAFFTEQRTRLTFLYKNEKLKLGASIQDIRIWGETGQINKSDGLTSFHEAFAEYAFTNKLSAKVGRQELDYDDARILGNLDWAAQARSHDALLFKYTDSLWALHAGAAFNQNSSPAEPAKLTETYYNAPDNGGFTTLGGGLPNPKHMYFLWFKHGFRKLNYSILALSTGWQRPDTSVNWLNTVGINPAFRASEKFLIDGSFYYQFGWDRTGKETSAWLGSLNLTYSGIKKFAITVGGDYLSGTAPGTAANVSNAFEPLFGTNHKFYGWMDYFYVGNPSAQGGRTIGLIDPYIKTKVTTSSKSFLLAHFHQFISPVDIVSTTSPVTGLSRNLGTEIDLVYQYNFSPSFIAMVGYSHLFPTASMAAVKGGSTDRTANWAWLMLVFKPTLAKI